MSLMLSVGAQTVWANCLASSLFSADADVRPMPSREEKVQQEGTAAAWVEGGKGEAGGRGGRGAGRVWWAMRGQRGTGEGEGKVNSLEQDANFEGGGEVVGGGF
eukprot:663121-Hanusia_phi.AAC.1